ncbi:MAG: hypothetical protein H8D42_05860, partial [Candidatus Marinimicrobia bacterium]|nr:hypothetical protein [Candidatus Neomarinimicrobiota bacterium]
MKKHRYLKKPNKVIANRRKDEKRLLIAFIGVIWLLTVVLIYFCPKSAPSKSIVYLEGKSFLNNTVRNSLAKQGFTEVQIESDNTHGLFLAFAVPPGMSDEKAIETVKPIIQRKGCSVRSVNRFSQNRGFMVLVDYYNQSIGTITFLKGENLNDYLILKGELRSKPKLAVIIDDFGYSNGEV